MSSSAAPSHLRFRRSLLLLIAVPVLLAASAQAQPTLSKVFTPSAIGPGSVSAATFTITNGSGTPVTGVGFTDVLPAAVDIADPANVSTNCTLAGGGALSAPDGGDTITLTNAQLGAFSSCTIRVDVTSSVAGLHTNPAVTLNSSAGSSMSLPVDLTVDSTRPGFLKSFAPDVVSLGSRTTMTLTFDNSANALAVTFLSFTDTFPPGLEIADPANLSYDCGMLNFTLSASAGSNVVSLLAQGAAVPGFELVPAGGTCSITVDVVTTGSGDLDNVTGDLTIRRGIDPNTVSSGKASATLESTVSELHLTKEFTDDPTPPGGTAELEFTILNFNRFDSATGVSFIDDLNAALSGLTYTTLLANSCGGMVGGLGTSLISLTGGTIAVEGDCTIRVGLTVPPAATPGVYANTTGTVSATVGGSPVVGNMATDSLYVEPVPLLTKTFVGDPVSPGDTIQLDFMVTNTSTTSSATDIAFTDFLPEVLQTASVTPGNGCCGAGSTCTFTPLINPPPPSSVTPARLTISGGTLAPAGMPDDSCSFSITLDVSSGAAPGIYVNTTTEITATVDGDTRTGNPATDDFAVIAAPDLSKRFADDPVAPGGSVTLEFSLAYPEDSAGDATDIAFTDDLGPVLTNLVATGLPLAQACDPDGPGGDPGTGTLSGSVGNTLLTLAGATLSPGETCTISVTLDVPADAAPGTYGNTTSGVGATVGGVPATSAAASDDLTVAGLIVTKEFLGDPVIAGDTVTLRFTIDNVHPTDVATSIRFTDSLSAVLPGTPDIASTGPPTANTCGGTEVGTINNLDYQNGTLNAGLTCIVDYEIQVPAGAADGTYVNTTGLVVATQGGGPVVFANATDTLTIDSSLLQLTKSFTDDPVPPGDPVTLEFTLNNLDAGNAASNVDFTDDLGAALIGLTFDSILLNDCGAMVSGLASDMITVEDAGLAAGGTCTIRVSLTVPGGATDGTYLNTTSMVTGEIDSFTVAGDPASAFLEVSQPLVFSKSFDGPSTATGAATLTFTITNPGSDTASNLAFTDNLDDVLSGLIATGLPAAPCGLGSTITGVSFLTFSGGSLPPMGGTCSFDVDVLVPASAGAGTYPNTTSDLFQSGLMVADPATADLVIEPPPDFDKTFMPGVVGPGVATTLRFTIDNTDSSLAAADLDFTDNLPAGLTVAALPSASTTCTGGTLTATAGTGVITYTGGTVAAASTCTVQADVAAATTGFFNNTTGELTSTSGNSGTANAVLAVDPPPGFDKSFSPDMIAIGGVSTLTFTFDNSLATVAATGLDFTDNLPAAVTVATPSNATTDCTGGILTAADGSGVITYSGGSVAAGATLTLEVDVTSSTVGMHVNTSGALTSSLGNSGTANDKLTVNPPPLFSKSFAPNPSIIGGVVTLTFTIDNTASTASATGLDFTDNLPAALLVATPANITNGCSGGAVTANEGTGTISYNGGTVAAGAICTISVDVISSAAGDHVNTTGELTSSLGSSGTAEDSLRVNPPPGFSKAFQPSDLPIGTVGTLVLSINNTSSTVAATDLDFIDNLPADVVIATPAGVVNDCAGGILTATAGTGVVSYTGGTVPAGASCSISVDVTSDVLGTYVNTTSDLTSSLGNSGPAMATLDVVDIEPPTVTAITTVNGPLEVCDDLRLPVSSIDVSFEDDASPLVGVDAAASYLLVGTGADGDFATTDCAGGVAGDDVGVTILNVAVDDTDPLAVDVELTVAGEEGLAGGLYRFFVCGSIEDAAGNPLAGGDVQVSFFRANPLNLFVNGHFDDCPSTLDPWTVTATPLNAVQTGIAGTDDFVGSPLSASAHFVQVELPASSLGQCVPAVANALYDLESWLRYDAPTNALAVYEQSCEFFDGAGCTGTSLGEASVASLLENAGAAWNLVENTFYAPVGAASALCRFETGPLGVDPLFNLYVDGLFLGDSNAGRIFRDGFESGDTSAWSSTVP